MLYELLTGSPPYLEGGRRAAPRELVREVRAGSPRPVLELNSEAPPELAAICQKAMARDQEARYPTAGAWAEDLTRYLEDQTVLAHPATRGYRFRKLVRRYRTAFIAMTVVALTLVLASAVSTWQAIRATRARHAEQSQLNIARQERTRAEQEELQLGVSSTSPISIWPNWIGIGATSRA